MNKALVYENTGEIESFKTNVKRGLESVPPIIAEYNKLGLQPIETPDQLQRLIDNTKACVIDRLPISDDQKMFGFPVSREKAFDLLSIDLRPLEAVILASDRRLLQDALHVLKATSKGFEVDADKLQAVIEQWRVYAETEAETEVYKAVAAIQANYAVLQKCGLRVRDLGTVLSQSAYDETNAPAKLNPSTYRKLADQANRRSA